MPPIYLDYAATTPVDPEVAALMATYLASGDDFGNPASSSHLFGRRAKQAVERAREQVATLLNANPSEIIWTSGATESNNLALQGAAYYYRSRGNHLITCKTEHKAVLDVCRHLERNGFEVTYLNPRTDGLLDLAELEAAIRPTTTLLSIMHVNNETGVVQDIAAIGRLTRSQNILLHIDAAQSAGKLPLDLTAVDADLVSLCAHKVYGPKGIGALYVRRRPRVRLRALLHGGGQERGLRAGTLATHQIVGMGAASALAGQRMARDHDHVQRLYERLWTGGLKALPQVYLNGSEERAYKGIVNVSFAGIAAEALLMDLPAIALASGSACSSATQEPSHVLRTMGLSDQRIDSAVRFSFGRYSTLAEIDATVQAVTTSVARLRALSPLWPRPDREALVGLAENPR